jgi:hypothetical protein
LSFFQLFYCSHWAACQCTNIYHIWIKGTETTESAFLLLRELLTVAMHFKGRILVQDERRVHVKWWNFGNFFGKAMSKLLCRFIFRYILYTIYVFVTNVWVHKGFSPGSDKFSHFCEKQP